MRDQNAEDSEGNLTAAISMKPIMTYAKFAFENVAANDFKIKKVVFKLKGGMPLPNVAYVKPSEMVASYSTAQLGYQIEGETKKHTVSNVVAPWWAFETEDNTAVKTGHEDNCANLLAWTKYDRQSFTQEAARDLVQYVSTVDGHIPYGMTEEQAAPIYEYVFNFPADADILYGTGSKEADTPEDRTCKISIALPAFGFAPDAQAKHGSHYSYYWKDMEVVVYGEYYDPNVSAYRPGIIRKIHGNDNATFGLDQMALWEIGMDIPMSTVVVDDDYFYQMEEIRVSNTADLINLLNARLSSPQTAVEGGMIMFDIYPYGESLEITDDVMKVIEDYEAAKKVDVVLNFKASGSIVGTPNIVLNAENSIDEFIYSGVNVVVEAAQTIEDVTINGINNLTNFSTLTIQKVNENTALYVNSYINNEVGATINVTKATLDYTVMYNEGTLNATSSTLNGGTINNAAVMNVTSSTINGSVNNNNECPELNCGKDLAVLTFNGACTSGYITNYDKLIVNGTLSAQFKNKYGAKFEVNGIVYLTAISENEGTIDIAAGAEDNAETYELRNAQKRINDKYVYGVINVEGRLRENIANQGVINVINNGWVVVGEDSDVYGIIDVTKASGTTTANAAYDKSGENSFRYTLGAEDIKGTILRESLETRISKDNIEESKIILVWGAESASTFYGIGHDELNITRVIINNDLTIKEGKETKFSNLNNDCDAVGYSTFYDVNSEFKAFQINGKLTVANGASLTLNDGANVWVAGLFKANNSSVVAGECSVYGTLNGEVDAYQASTFDWTNAGIAANNWTGK